MNHGAITPAQIAWDDDGTPLASAFGDIYRPRQDRYTQAQQVFLQGNGLPERWRGCSRFTVLETGFGLAHNFIATLQAWRSDAERAQRLAYVAIEQHPPRAEDLVRAHGEAAAELVRQWPVLVAGVHSLRFDDGRVQLLLAFGDVQQLMPTLRLAADAVFLDGFAPDRNPAIWSRRVFEALARRCAPGATAATWSVARAVRDGLALAGFEVRRVAGAGGKREVLQARFAPRFALPPAARAPQEAVVIGAGLAGASVASALAAKGVAVTVLERHPGVAAEASGNPGGIFHGVVHPDDGPYARLLRAGALFAAPVFAEAIAKSDVPGQVTGFLRLERSTAALPAMQALIERFGLPPSYVSALDADAASAHAGWALARPAWHFPQGGWVSPAGWVQHSLARPGITLRTGVAAASWQRDGQGELVVHDAEGRPLARAGALVIAAPAAALAAALASAALRAVRGQVSWSAGPMAGAPRLPLASDGYALTLPGGQLLFGATSSFDDGEASEREADHAHNLARLQQLLPQARPPLPLAGRVGWRIKSGDRLPLAGALPLPDSATPSERLARWPRESGVFTLTALGSRGLTWAPLLGELVAAQVCGTPWPVTQDLADAVDPARFLVRAYRQAAAN